MADEETTEQVDTPPEPTVEELRSALAERDAQVKLYKDTLAALGSGRTPHSEDLPPSRATAPAPGSAAGVLPSDAEIAREMAKRHGYDEGQVSALLPVMREMIRLEAGPAVQALVATADKTAQLEARLSIDDWNDIKDEANKVAKEYGGRGIRLSYEDAATIARSRLGPELAERRKEASEKMQRDRSKAARSAGDTGTVEKPGPTVSKVTSGKPKTRADIEAIEKREDRVSELEKTLGDAAY